MPSPLEIEVETKARRLLAEMRRLAELSEGLSDAERAAIGERLQPELDATEEAMATLFPGAL
jgi:hypothetical protein